MLKEGVKDFKDIDFLILGNLFLRRRGRQIAGFEFPPRNQEHCIAATQATQNWALLSHAQFSETRRTDQSRPEESSYRETDSSLVLTRKQTMSGATNTKYQSL